MVAHGTMVASLISAQRREGEDGMWGLAPGCTILAASQGLPVHGLLLLQREFFAKNPKATMASLQKEMAAHASEVKAFSEAFLTHMFGTTAEAILYLADRGVRVVSISIDLSLTHVAALPAVKHRLEAAFEYARQRDVFIVVGAGNTGQRITDYPGDTSFVMVAGAATLDG
jgi:subtilisin family serine protease